MTTLHELDRLRSRFQSVAQLVGDRLAAANPRMIALIAKWSKDDLVPGLSDMDFRVVCDETSTADDWVEIDWHVGRIHCQMVEEHPEWNRINEHTPGAGVSLAELQNERFHHPEYPVWTVWWGRDDWANRLKLRTLPRPLCALDEHYHLARFLSYYSPYIDGIDPPINLGVFEPKYALHSRCWHYFAPPMLSAATLLARKHFASKREGLLWLADHGFAVDPVQAVLRQVESHYETKEQSDPEQLDRFEHLLFSGFEELLQPVCRAAEHLELPIGGTRQLLQQHLASHVTDPLVELLENVRFTRIRAGRCYFYLNAPSHFSADRQLIQEQGWMRKLVNSTLKLLRVLQGNHQLSAEECFEKLGIELDEHKRAALQFALLLADSHKSASTPHDAYRRAIDLLPIYYRLVEDAFQRLWADQRGVEVNPHEIRFQFDDHNGHGVNSQREIHRAKASTVEGPFIPMPRSQSL